MNIRGVLLHVKADALGSVIVIISAVIIWQMTVSTSASVMLLVLIVR